MKKTKILLMTLILLLFSVSCANTKTSSSSKYNIPEKNNIKTEEYSIYQASEHEIQLSETEVSDITVPEKKETDRKLVDEAKPFLDIFKENYPDSEVVKIRWQMEQGRFFTYVIEGLNPKNKDEKYALKMLGENKQILGRGVEKKKDSENVELSAFEPITTDDLLTLEQLKAIAKEDENIKLIGWSLQCREGKQIIILEVENTEERTRDMFSVDSKTGEIVK